MMWKYVALRLWLARINYEVHGKGIESGWDTLNGGCRNEQ